MVHNKPDPDLLPLGTPITELVPVAHKRPILPIFVVLLLILVLGTVTIVAISRNHGTNKTDKPKTIAQLPLEPAQVSITASGFMPATIKVKKGQSITWTNQDSQPHQIASDPYPTEDSLPGINADTPERKADTFTASFEKSGTYTYHDHLNPLKLKGTVIVE